MTITDTRRYKVCETNQPERCKSISSNDFCDYEKYEDSACTVALNDSGTMVVGGCTTNTEEDP